MKPTLITRVVVVAMLATLALAGSACSCDPPPAEGEGEGEAVVCVAGQVDCDCRAAAPRCDTDLACTDGSCTACAFGTLDCPCDSGACGDDVCDDNTDLCRVPSDCEAAGCAQRQLCEQNAGEDAVCLSACEAGFTFNAATSLCDPLPSCTSTDPGYCGDERACSEGGATGDTCGLCNAGFVDVAGACLLNTCAGIDCEGREHRLCSESAAGALCGDCLEGFIDDNGTCVDIVTCEDLNCQAPQECVFVSGSETPECRVPSLCPDNQVQNSAGTCVGCSACFNGGAAVEGTTGVGNGGVAFGSTCICALQDNFFQGVDGVVRSCDADGDGWVNSRLLTSLNLNGNPNNPFAANSRCDVRVIDRFELRGDDFRDEFTGVGTYNANAQRTVLVADLNLGVATAKLYEPEETDDPTAFGLRYKQQGTTPEKLLRSYGLTPAVNEFADGVVGHLRAAEVNPLTKACNHDNDDINLDGIADVAQVHGAFPAGANGFGPDAAPAAATFYRFAYFIELAHGSFRDRGGAGLGNCNGAAPCFGAFVIQEKLRAPDTAANGDPESLRLELNYGPAADTNWQTCMRGRDSTFPGGTSATAQNSDFAEWTEGCENTSGTCFVGSTSDRHIPYDGRPVNPNRTLDGVAADVGVGGEARFVGMNHASQFKCVSFDTAQSTVTPARRKPTDRSFVFNDCRLDPRLSDPDLTPGTPNPVDPVLACATTTPEPSGATADNRNFWVALTHEEYASPAAYEQGCISEGDEWGDLLCVVEPNSTPDANFGQLFCACGNNRGGLDCELTCPTLNVLQNRTADVATGELSGFFSCFIPAGSAGGELSGGAFKLRGAVPAFSAPLTEQSGGSFTLSPVGAFP